MSLGQTESRCISHEDLAAIAAEVFREGGTFRFRAHGRSMWPFVRDGDVLLVRQLRDRSIRCGDILLFRSAAGRLAAHRVTSVVGDVVNLRGDRLRAPLERIDRERVMGRVIAVEREGKRLSKGLWWSTARAWMGLRAGLRLGRRLPARVVAAVSSLFSPAGRPERR